MQFIRSNTRQVVIGFVSVNLIVYVCVWASEFKKFHLLNKLKNAIMQSTK